MLQMEMQNSNVGRLLDLCVVQPIPTRLFHAVLAAWTSFDAVSLTNFFDGLLQNACHDQCCIIGRSIFNFAYTNCNPRLMSSLAQEAQIILDEKDRMSDRQLAVMCLENLSVTHLRWFFFESGLTDKLICDGSLVAALVHKELLCNEKAGRSRINEIVKTHPTFYKAILGKSVLPDVNEHISAFKSEIANACCASILRPSACAVREPPS